MEVVQHPSPILKSRAREVDATDDGSLRELVRVMAETMYDESGVGLAAPQVGVDKRVIVFDVDEKLAALCNPVITNSSDETIVEDEGCLSVPGISVPVQRAARITCTGQTIEGHEVTIEAEEFLARVLQHEIDHLDGVIILDRCDPALRKEIIRTYNEVNNL